MKGIVRGVPCLRESFFFSIKKPQIQACKMQDSLIVSNLQATGNQVAYSAGEKTNRQSHVLELKGTIKAEKIILELLVT